MNIAVINGTEKHGVTRHLKEIFLEPFREKAEITEFYLPRDCPNFCAGCTVCFLTDQHKCKDAQYVQKIEQGMPAAGLLVFTPPAYVFHATGAMKAMPDHFGCRRMPHRPAKEMFGKRAVIITQCLGSGAGSAAKDIKDSLSRWGISSVKVCQFRLMGDIVREKLPEKKRSAMTASLKRAAEKLLNSDLSRPARTGIAVKLKFYAVRMMQKQLGKNDPEYTDYRYRKSNVWLDGARPWCAQR